MLEEITRDDLIEAVEAVVADLLEAAGVHEPPVDVRDLARRHLGLVAQPDAPPGGRGCGRRHLSTRREVSGDRLQWTVAQEVGDLLKPRVLERLGVPVEASGGLVGASVANLFAFRLLLPTPWFAEEATACEYDLFALKERFATAGYEVLAGRLLDLPEPCIITIHDNGSIVRRKGNAYRPPKELAPAETACLTQVRDHGRPFTLSRDGWRVQGWPVHTVDWRREILRSVVDEDALRGGYAE